jgi:hypothetical protein
VTGQVVGLGGDRLTLWSHPSEVAVVFADGGWDAPAIADVWPKEFAGHVQGLGQTFPDPY